MTRKPSRLPFLILGAMTLLTFGGPVLIGYVLQGGSSPKWPPDRPVEWATFFVISGMVVLMMLACVPLALLNHKAMARKAEANSKSEKTGAEP
jgi:hypothetical protein